MDTDSLYQTLRHVYLHPVSVSSDFSRYHAQQIAALASLGLVSSRVGRREFGKVWRITEEGMETLQIEGFL